MGWRATRPDWHRKATFIWQFSLHNKIEDVRGDMKWARTINYTPLLVTLRPRRVISSHFGNIYLRRLDGTYNKKIDFHTNWESRFSLEFALNITHCISTQTKNTIYCVLPIPPSPSSLIQHSLPHFRYFDFPCL